MTERNWQEDMKLSEQAKGWIYEITFNGEGNIVAKDANYTFAQVIAGDVGMSNAEIILDGLEALPYWLQQYAALEREYERFQKAAMGWNDDLTKAEAEIEQKDAEITKLRSAIAFSIAEYELHENPGAAAECMWQILYTHVQPKQASLLQDKGDTQ
ncbi:hypothetical protein HFE03_03530 [Paenibacillus sp. EKM102P]|uniref:hypothetical protein n=1 Tax=unclassified Paenibacillus TaxID=185978 RepID=UPI0015F2BF28|nr:MULTISPECIES: hypothetical protein [unclassified Paenibacillus]KAF6618281.1 hypothetical protein HFE00_09370 [Paenibacillus sp. EKM101P]KAF6624626.1 hypothetical protein HFE03_03530 [Paenibacillus sp. EKM102P]KAF6635595.1 hypothetical protein HFE01_01500 [Paenibacillus sp. EKM10P]KAF6648695.1 hypothetical protein HFE02_10050 [Paenibacillus sp. EKM11P]